MARKSRKKRHVDSAVSGNIQRTALYVRLSNEDAKMGESIESQTHILRQYLKGQKDLEEWGLYCDNGYSGTNFYRPAFRRLMDDVHKGGIDCILIKDLSRFGRNLLECGALMDLELPKRGVRLISLGEGYDSQRDGNFILKAAFKNLFNELYARDISRKTRASFAVKKQEGKYLGGRAPYGYCRKSSDRGRLEPCKEEAQVVSKIFQWEKAGLSYEKIARCLNLLEIPSPGNSRKGQDSTNAKIRRWSGRTVSFLVHNPVYGGKIVYGKTKSKAFGEKGRILAGAEEWEYRAEAHEKIGEEAGFLERL